MEISEELQIIKFRIAAKRVMNFWLVALVESP